MKRFPLLLLFLCSACQKPAAELMGFRIVLVGNGVPSETQPPRRLFRLDEAQGVGMWEAAQLALDSSRRTLTLRERVQLEGFDDGGDTVEAEKIASELVDRPEVLAIIGHTSSATTRAAANVYRLASIPLLMPIATSPRAMLPLAGGPRARNAFRLIPSDDRAQAPAVALIATDSLRARSIYLVADVSPAAREHSEPLADAIASLLTTVPTVPQLVDRTRDDLGAVAEKIRAQRADLVIFVGYVSTAQELLFALRNAYPSRDSVLRPRLILTDGARDSNLDVSGFESYWFFPLPGTEAFGNGSSDLQLLRKLRLRRGQETYEMYSYDAVLILAEAVDRCADKGISRSCIIDELASGKLFRGVVLSYSFREGENSLSGFNVFRSSPNDPTFTLHWRLSSEVVNTTLAARPR